MSTKTAETSGAGMRDNWWHVIGAVPAAAVLQLPVVVYDDLLAAPRIFLAAGGLLFFLSFGLPFAFYFDARYVSAVAPEWSPNPRLYAAVGVLGVVAAHLNSPEFPAGLLTLLVCGPYLYLRSRHVGTP